MNIFKKENSSYQNMSLVTYSLREKKNPDRIKLIRNNGFKTE